MFAPSAMARRLFGGARMGPSSDDLEEVTGLTLRRGNAGIASRPAQSRRERIRLDDWLGHPRGEALCHGTPALSS